MNYQDRNKDELIAELLKLQQENISLKAFYENEIENSRQNEIKLQMSEARFRSYFDLPFIGIAITSPDKGWIEANEGIRDMLGYSMEELSGLTWAELTHPDDLPADVEQFNKVVSDQQDIYFLEKRFIRKTGEIIWTKLSVGCVRKPDRSVDYMIALLQNISKRKLAEREKERTQKLLEDSQRIGKIGGWEINFDTMELNWTKEMYHIHEVDLTFKPQIDQRANFYTPESLPDVDKAVQQAIEKGESYEIDSEIITAKGNRRWVKAIGKADLENRRVFGFFQDITDRKHAEAELKIKNEQLKELNATKDKFFSIIAHDLKTPFSGILGFSEILKDEARNLDISSIENYADIINSTAKQTFKLLENLLDWARMQQSGFNFEPKTISFNYLLKAELEGLKNGANRKNITLVNGTAKEIIFKADEKMLSTVLRNLIANAIKFTPKGGEINIETLLKDDHVEVSISDTGVGMEKEILEKLFKIETSFTSRGTENEKGTGLGLLLCKEFVEKHGGTIWVDSEKGKGSTFTFSIPIATEVQ